jgi:HK97 family phage prohead protease
MTEMSSKSINDLDDDQFAYIQDGGHKDAEGKTTPRSLRHFPIHDAAHVRNALARASQSPFGEKAMPKIRAAAKKFGVEVGDDNSRSDLLATQPGIITRTYPLDDIDVQKGRLTCERCGQDATGRLVDAYAAVFRSQTEIYDDQGHYIEEIDPAAFNRTINNSSQNGYRNVSVFYNHGRTLYGTPSESGSISLGHVAAIRSDANGLLTTTHYGRHDMGEQILTQIVAGDISGHSFTGRTFRSNPSTPPRVSRGGDLPLVVRLELGLQEYGPTPIPYYQDTRVLAVRSGLITDQHFGTGAEPAVSDSHAGDSPSGTQGGVTQEEIAERIRQFWEERKSE